MDTAIFPPKITTVNLYFIVTLSVINVSLHYHITVARVPPFNLSKLSVINSLLWPNNERIYLQWMNYAFIVYCCTPKALYNHGGGGSLLNHHQCAASTWMMRRLPQDNGASALTTHRLQVERREIHRANQVDALTTHQLQVERREIHRANQVDALTTHQLQVERREIHRANQVDALTTHQLQVERREIHRANQVDALTTHQLQVERREIHRANQVDALTTHQLQVERREREIEPIKWMGIIRRPWLTRASGGNLARTPVLHPYSLREVPWDF